MRNLSLIGLSIVAVATIPVEAFGHDGRMLGDGRLSTAPKAGYVFSCQQRFNPNAPGTSRGGDWIVGNKYYPDRKPVVGGKVMWPNARIDITIQGDIRIVSANNLPTHPTGIFPVPANDPVAKYARNPNRIREQNILLRLPVNPKFAAKPSCVPMGMIGFTRVGGAMYNALDARGRDAAAHEFLDLCGGHPQQQGQYHYHDYTLCMTKGTDKNGHSVLIGYALDGFGIFGPKDVGGRKIANKDLDACHGHIGPVMWDGKVRKIYHYHINNEYPYSVGCFKGTPISVARPGGPPPRTGGPGGGNDPLTTIAQELNLDVNKLRRAVGPPPPNLRRASRMLGIDMSTLRAAFQRHRPR